MLKTCLFVYETIYDQTSPHLQKSFWWKCPSAEYIHLPTEAREKLKTYFYQACMYIKKQQLLSSENRDKVMTQKKLLAMVQPSLNDEVLIVS